MKTRKRISKMETTLLLSLLIFISAVVKAQPPITPLIDKNATINGTKIHYKIGGSGPCLLLLHGFTLSGEQWSPFVEALAKDYLLIIPDLPGHGGSDMPEGTYSFEKAGKIMLGLLKHLNIKQVKGIGHSGGAVTLMEMATQSPSSIEVMILVDGGHRFTEDVKNFLIEDSFEKSEKAFQDYYLAIHPGGMPQINAIFKAENDIARNYSTTEGLKTLSPKVLANMSMPILLIWGERDDLFPLNIGMELYQLLPNAQLWVIPGQGHVPLWSDLGGDANAGEQFIPLAKRFFNANLVLETPSGIK